MNLDKQTIEKQVRSMNEQIGRLKKKVEANDDVQDRVLETQIRILEDRMDLFKMEAERFKLKASQASEEMATGLSDAWEKVKSSYERAESYLSENKVTH
jgi:hypothetical protein